MEIIAGDIGGTKSWLVWARGTDYASQALCFERLYASADFADAGSLLQQFMRDAQMQATSQSIAQTCLTLALPGAVYSQQAKLTNLGWTLDAVDLQTRLGVKTVHFINDFQASATGVTTLTASDLLALNPQPVETLGVRAITGAGTGLGFSVDDRGRARVLSHVCHRGWPCRFRPGQWAAIALTRVYPA